MISWIYSMIGRKAAPPVDTISPPMGVTRTPADELLWDLGNTAKARFIAAKRLEHADRGITRVTSFTSAYLIVLSAVPYFLELGKAAEDRINLFTMSLAVVILVSSLLQYSTGAVVNAEQHHRSGLEINEIYRELEFAKSTISDDQLSSLRSRYQSVLQKYSVNHDKVDWLQVKIERRWEHPGLSDQEVRRIKTIIARHRNMPTYALIAISTLSALVVLGYAVPLDVMARGIGSIAE